MGKWKNTARNILLAFALISIGYAIGKNISARTGAASVDSGIKIKSGKYLLVYYMHASVRCETCNNIEKMAYNLLKSKFKKELEGGLIEWRVANFQENEKLAKEFDVVSSGVVVVLMNGNKVVNYKRLDEVWTLLNDPPSFNAYLDRNIREMLQ
jgi:hypothetical protein